MALKGATTRPMGRRLKEASPVDRKSTRLNSSHLEISHAAFCLKKKMPDWWFTSARLLPRAVFHDPGGSGHGGQGDTSLILVTNSDLVKLENVAKTNVPQALELP